MTNFFIFLGVMITVNAIGWIPVFVICAINNSSDIEDALVDWHIVMTMMIATFLALFTLDPSLFNLMWIE